MILLFVMLMLMSSVASAMNVAITIPEITKPHESYATLSITLRDVQNYGTGTISIAYDPAVVHVTGVSDGPDSTVLDWNPNNTSGIVIISAWNMDGVSGDIIFANVTFHAVGSPGTSTTLKLNVTTLQDNSFTEIPVSISDGTFNIETEDGGGGVTPTPTPTPSPTEPSAGGGGGGDGGTIAPSDTETPTSSSTASVTPTTPLPAVTPSPSPTPTPTEIEEEKATPTYLSTPAATPGFETIFACSALLIAFAYLLLMRMQKRGGDSV